MKVQPVSVVSPDIHMGENIQNPPQDNVELQDHQSTDIQGVDLEVELGNDKPVPPVDVQAKYDEVEFLSSHPIDPSGASSILAKVITDTKPVLDSQQPIPELKNMEGLDFATLQMQYETHVSRNRAKEDGIIAIMKRKYGVHPFPYLHITCSPQAPSL